MLPAEIPERLRTLAVDTDLGGDSSGAWTRATAIEVIESLEGTWIVVLGASVCVSTPGPMLVVAPSWEFKPVFGESAADRAQRSRTGAMFFVRSLPDHEDTYVALEFSSQDEAA